MRVPARQSRTTRIDWLQSERVAERAVAAVARGRNRYRDYDADRMMIVIAPRYSGRRRKSGGGPPLLQLYTSTAVLPASAMHATGVASSDPAPAAESVAANMLIPAAASAAIASSRLSHTSNPA
eukprot:6209668-Pleurochrysis_carterae.AAC.1